MFLYGDDESPTHGVCGRLKRYRFHLDVVLCVVVLYTALVAGILTLMAQMSFLELPAASKKTRRLPSSSRNNTLQSKIPKEVDSIEWSWHYFNNNSTPGRRKLLIAQYVGGGKDYLEMMELSARASRAYARKWNCDYLQLKGIPIGWKPEHGTYNKPPMIKMALSRQSYDTVLLLDADAVIVDHDYNMLQLLPEEYMIAARAVSKDDPHTANVNIGVTLWNLKHAYTREVVDRWHHLCQKRAYTELKRRADDQRILHHLLRDEYNKSQLAQMIYALNTTHIRYRRGTAVRHFIRKNATTWEDKNSGIDRVEEVRAAVQKVCGPNLVENPLCQ